MGSRIRRAAIGTLLLTAVTLSALGAASYRRHFTVDFSPHRRLWCQIVVTDGNLRLVGAWVALLPAAKGDATTDSTDVAAQDAGSGAAVATGTGDDPGPTPAINAVRLFWRRHLLVATPWSVHSYAHNNPGEQRHGARVLRLDACTFILAGLLLPVAWLIGPGRRWLAQIPGIWREIRRPSVGGFFYPPRRAVRRTAVALMSLTALAALVLSSASSTQPVTWNLANPIGGLRLLAFGGGTGTVEWKRDASAGVTGYNIEYPGFRLTSRQSYSWMPQPGEQLDPAQLLELKTLAANPSRPNPERVDSLEFSLPLLAGFLLLYPLHALVCGPVRRNRRKCDGLCLYCGYNLNGLIEPRCPECGRAFAVSVPASSVDDPMGQDEPTGDDEAADNTIPVDPPPRP
ncbi:MAG: hypothetical protein ACE5EX_04040 [Phycisphaerae bacterium]